MVKIDRNFVLELLDLYKNLAVPFMQVRRDMPFPGEGGRNETDSEHVFSLSLIALTVAEKLKPELDSGLIAKYCLIHDLVEAYAGDVSARDANAYAKKDAAEHEAFIKIKENYKNIAPWIIKHIEKYESREDEESKFVYLIDKCMGPLTRMADDGEFWKDYYPEPDGRQFYAVIARIRKKAEIYPELLPLFDEVHTELDRRWPDYLNQASKKQQEPS